MTTSYIQCLHENEQLPLTYAAMAECLLEFEDHMGITMSVMRSLGALDSLDVTFF
jgi:hypothetical protein